MLHIFLCDKCDLLHQAENCMPCSVQVVAAVREGNHGTRRIRQAIRGKLDRPPVATLRERYSWLWVSVSFRIIRDKRRYALSHFNLAIEAPLEQTLSFVTFGDPTPAMKDVIDAVRRLAEKIM
jgi:hypothetical protein